MDLESMPILKIFWIVCCVMILADVIMSIYVAAANDNEDGGHKSSGFVAVWSMFLVVAFGVFGTRVIMSQKSTNLFVGFLLGMGGMLAQLFFALSVYFFLMAKNDKEHESDHEHSKDQEAANDGMGAFCLINSIALAVWTGILTYKKGELYLDNVSGLEGDDVPAGNAGYDEAMVGQSI